MKLTKSTSCTAVNESYYSGVFINDIKIIVTKHIDSSKVKDYIYMHKNGKCSKIKMELFQYPLNKVRKFKQTQ
jgi:hypothetical protein